MSDDRLPISQLPPCTASVLWASIWSGWPNIQSLKRAAYNQVGSLLHQRGHWTPVYVVPKPFWSSSVGWRPPCTKHSRNCPIPSTNTCYVVYSQRGDRKQTKLITRFKRSCQNCWLSMSVIFFTQFPWWSFLCAKVLSQFFQGHCELCVSLLSSLQHRSFHVSGVLPYILT